MRLRYSHFNLSPFFESLEKIVYCNSSKLSKMSVNGLCRFELCLLAEQIIGSEFNAPNFTVVDINNSSYEKARYFYVYICRTHLNASHTLIRKTMPVYSYKKTVYQVFKRMWERRKKEDNEFVINCLKREFDSKINHLKSHDVTVRAEGVQLKLNFN
jgi:hypothetical protein